MVDNFPLVSLVEDLTAAPSGHLSVHKAERRALNVLQAAVSAYGIAPLDLFAVDSSNASDKVDAAMAYVGNLAKSDGTGTQGLPTVRMGLKIYEFTRSLGQPGYHGFRMEGCSAYQVHQKSTATDNFQTRVKLTIPPASGDSKGYWLNVTSGQPFNYSIGGFAGYSDRSDCVVYRAPFINGTTTGIREGNLYNQTWQNVQVFGTAAEPFTTTICDIVGGWGIFAPPSGASPVNLRGSDNRNIFGDGLDIYAVGTGNGQYLMNFVSDGKSRLGPVYLTASGTWQGMRVNNGAGAGMLSMSGAVLEGNNEGQPSMGALLRVDAGNFSLRDSTIDCGMASPSGTASANGGTASRGLVEVLAGAQVSLDVIDFAHATGQDPTTLPCIYNASTKLDVRGLQTCVRGGGPTWGSQLPVISGVDPRSANDGSWVKV